MINELTNERIVNSLNTNSLNIKQNTMTQQLLFSVLIANYNNGKYLMDAIESVRQQTYTNWEIILVDDGSTDNSHELYKELEQDERIHIFLNDQNHGCGYTKRRCAELANGEICGFLDPDDALIDNALELMVNVHIIHPKVSVVYSKAYFCDTKFNVLEQASLPDFSNGKTYFNYRNHGSMNLATYKNAFYKLTDGINPNLQAGVDQDLYFRIEEVGDIYVLDEFTYKYVVKGHDSAISTNFDTYAKLWYWNLIARRDTCLRRNIPERILIDDFQKILDNYVKGILERNSKEVIDKIVAERLYAHVYKKECEIRSSKAYRLGKLLLKPLYKIKALFNNK